MRGEAAADDGPETHHRPRSLGRQGPSRRGGGLPPRQRRDSRISLSTVYRTIKLFEANGFLERHDFGAGRGRYEEAARPPHHDHLIDIESGKVIEFRNEEIERLQERVARELGFNLVGHKLELYGVPTPSNARASEMTQPKKIFVKTFGCQMNVYDSERMTELLGAHGLSPRRRRWRTPTSSSSTPATSARRRPRKSIPTSAASAR